MRAGYLTQYSDWLRAGRSGDRIPVEARFSAPVQTGAGAHPASCTMGTGLFPGVKSGWGVTLTTLYSPYGPYGLYRASVPVQGCTLPLPYSRAIPLLLLWAIRPVQSLSACTRVHFTCFYTRHSVVAILTMLQDGFTWNPDSIPGVCKRMIFFFQSVQAGRDTPLLPKQ